MMWAVPTWCWTLEVRSLCNVHVLAVGSKLHIYVCIMSAACMLKVYDLYSLNIRPFVHLEHRS